MKNNENYFKDYFSSIKLCLDLIEVNQLEEIANLMPVIILMN